MEKREVDEAESEFPVFTVARTYVPEEHRIREVGSPESKVFAVGGESDHFDVALGLRRYFCWLAAREIP